MNSTAVFQRLMGTKLEYSIYVHVYNYLKKLSSSTIAHTSPAHTLPVHTNKACKRKLLNQQKNLNFLILKLHLTVNTTHKMCAN